MSWQRGAATEVGSSWCLLKGRRVGRRDRDGALRCRCFVVKGHFDSPTSESLVHISGFFNTLPSPDPHRVTVGSDVPVQIGSNPAECCSFPMRIG